MRVDRLKRHSDFVRVARVRTSWRASAVRVQWAPSSFGARVGFTASKKFTAPQAVIRNRAKRRLRSWVDQNLLSISNEICGDFIFIATPLTAIISYAQLAEQCEEAVRQCLKKGRVSS